MSNSHSLEAPPASASARDPALVAAAIARLRAEYDAAGTSATRAILLHEIGALEESAGEEGASAKDQLAAANAESEFLQPIERLIAIIEQRQSYKNLGKLLERLVQVASRTEERTRARLEQAAYLWDHENDLAGARTVLEEAARESPDDSGIWLALELISVRLDDAELRERALAERARLAEPPAWRALLYIDLASLRREAGRIDGALDALRRAAEVRSESTFLVSAALAELGGETERWELEIEALERQAELISEALADPAAGDATGVPLYRRSQSHAADSWLRAAQIAREHGDTARGAALLERAASGRANDALLLHARLRAAEASADPAAAARVAEAALAGGTTGPRAAALWLRIADAAAVAGDSNAALTAVGRALTEDAGSVPARALYLDLLAMGEDRHAFVSALESTAEQLPTEAAKARYYLASADVWARECRDAQGARAALSQAGMYGAAPWLVARVARMLAALLDDPVWYDEATRRLIGQGASEGEQVSLWLELARRRALRGDRPSTSAAFDGLAAAPGGAWLGNLLHAYALDLLPEPSEGPKSSASTPPSATTAWAALKALSEHETDPELARALRVMAAQRALLQGDLAAALQELTELHASDASDVVVGAALATLELARGGRSRAAEVLAACAAATTDPELAVQLGLESGIRYWQAGERHTALECFSTANERSPGASHALLGWALRGAEPDNLEARRRTLEVAKDASPELVALERFALEVGRGGHPESAEAALQSASDASSAGLTEALLLGRALWAVGPNAAHTRADALDTLTLRGGETAAVASASAHMLELTRAGAANRSDLEQTARRWAMTDTSLASALEWLAAAEGASDTESEVLARRAIGERLGPGLSGAMQASAALVALLSRSQPPAPIRSGEPAAILANLELAAPGSDPRRRAKALLDAEPLLGEASSGLNAALVGYNSLAAGDIATALESFRRVVAAHPEDVMGWEGLRAAALANSDRATLARACAALGDAVNDGALGAGFWEQAAGILLDELADPKRGEYALGRAVARDIGRFSAFDRLFRIVRERKDGPRLLELIAARLDVADDPDEITKLFWERARVLRGAGDNEGALAALENVRMLEPDHVGALALSGEIFIRTQRFAEAAENLARLATIDEAPEKQRLMSGIAAVDLYENKLDDAYAALDVLAHLNRAGLGTQPVRERLARAAARAEAWDQATAVLEVLMAERTTNAGRIEAARLAMAIYRDRLHAPERAEASVKRLLGEAPEDAEALELVLKDVFSKETTVELLEDGLEALIEVLVAAPEDAERVERLAHIAAYLGNAPLRQAALGALVALGVSSPATEQELLRLDGRVAHVPSIAIDEAALPELSDPEDNGAIARLMRALAPTICAALGPNLAAFGVTKRERIEPRVGLPLRNEIAAWAGAFGIGEFELYVGGSDAEQIVGIASELPALVVGAGVSAPLSAPQRQAVARELFALRRGTSVLRHRQPAEIGALVVAACRVAEIDVPSPPFALLAEFQRLLGKEIPRRVRKLLPELARAVAESGEDSLRWYHAATASLDRMAAVAAGDVSRVLSRGPAGRGSDASEAARARRRRLLSFALSPSYLALRDKLGMGVR